MDSAENWTRQFASALPAVFACVVACAFPDAWAASPGGHAFKAVWESSSPLSQELPGSVAPSRLVLDDRGSSAYVGGSSNGSTSGIFLKISNLNAGKLPPALQWNRVLNYSTTTNFVDGLYDTYVTSIGVDPENNLLVVGTFRTDRGTRAYLLKVDGSTGEDIWAAHFEVVEDSAEDRMADVVPTGVVVDAQGNIYVAGTITRQIMGELGSSRLQNQGFLSKFNKNNHDHSIWQKVWGDADHSVDLMAVELRNGRDEGQGKELVLAGFSRDRVVVPASDQSGYLVMRIDAETGASMWKRVVRTGGYPGQANSLAIQADGSIYAAGYRGADAKSGAVMMSMLACFNPDGEQSWIKVFQLSDAANSTEEITRIAPGPGGTILATGYLNQNSGFIAKFGGDGELEKKSLFMGATGAFKGLDLQTADDSRIVYVIGTRSTRDSLSLARTDTFLAKFDFATLNSLQ